MVQELWKIIGEGFLQWRSDHRKSNENGIIWRYPLRKQTSIYENVLRFPKNDEWNNGKKKNSPAENSSGEKMEINPNAFYWETMSKAPVLPFVMLKIARWKFQSVWLQTLLLGDSLAKRSHNGCSMSWGWNLIVLFLVKLTKLDSHFRMVLPVSVVKAMVLPRPKLGDPHTGLWYPKPSWVIIILGHLRLLNPKHCMVGRFVNVRAKKSKH